MSYRFSGTGGSHTLQSAISSTPFPSGFPVALGGWVRSRDYTTNSCPINVIINGGADQQRIQYTVDGANFIMFIKFNASQAKNVTIPYPTGLRDGDWVFMLSNFVSSTVREGWIVHRGTYYTATYGTGTVGYAAFDQIVFGYLPFFGNINDWNGEIGSFAFWNRRISLPEVVRMGRGAPFPQNKIVDQWNFDGRIVEESVPSDYHKFDLTVSGPPAWSPQSQPTVPRRRILGYTPATSGLLPKMMQMSG